MFTVLYLVLASASLLPDNPPPPKDDYIVITAKKYCGEVEVFIEKLPDDSCQQIKRMEAFTATDGEDYAWVGCFNHLPTVEEAVMDLDRGTPIEHFPPRLDCKMET